MAVTSNVEVPLAAPKHRTKSPGVRVIRGIVYDSQNGKTCHQCRQKTKAISATCKNLKSGKKCPISFCRRCLSNRYNENAEEVDRLDNWRCPKCRGICNCSQCRKKSGHKPTGPMAHIAKQSGFSSVSEMLQIRGPDCLSGEKKIAEETVKEPPSLEKDSVADKENSFDGNHDSDLKSQNLAPTLNERKSKKEKREELKEINSIEGVDVSLRNEMPNEPQISEEISEKERFKISEDKVSEGIIGKEVITNERDGGEFVEKKKSRMQELKNDSLNLIEKEAKQGADFEIVVDLKDIENSNAGTQLQAVSESSKARKRTAELQKKKIVADIPLPQGANLKTVAGIEINPESSKARKRTAELQKKKIVADIPLPQGFNLKTVAGIEINPEDVGDTLQFLEFCAAFGEVLDLKKGEAEYILRELIRGRIRRRGQCCPIVQFHIKLLSLLQDTGEESNALSSTSGKTSWSQALGKCVSESQCLFNDIPSDCFEGDGYDKLDCSKKLKLLNFLCDEALSTKALRSWIEDQHSKYIDEVKQAKANIAAAKDKEKQLEDELEKVTAPENGTPSSAVEREALISKLKSEKDKANSEKLKAISMGQKKRRRLDALRTESILVEDNGHAFWRLKGHAGEPDIVLQDLQGNWDANAIDEKWFVYDADQKPAIEKYISSRTKKRRCKAKKPSTSSGTAETDL